MFTRSFLTACILTFGFAIFGLSSARSKESAAKDSIRIGTTVKVPLLKTIHLYWTDEEDLRPKQITVFAEASDKHTYVCSSDLGSNTDAAFHQVSDEDYVCDFSIPAEDEILNIKGDVIVSSNEVVPLTEFDDLDQNNQAFITIEIR